MQPKPIIVLDEFTYLICGNKAIPSILQKVWDGTLKNSQIIVVLCGLYIGLMETEVLGYQAPLYGWRTASTLLRPMDLASFTLFFPGYSAEEKFITWSVVGGMPYYLRTFQDSQDVYASIRQHILDHWYPKQIKTGRLSALYTVESARALSDLYQKSLEYKLLASGLNIKPVTFRILRIVAGVCGMVIAWLFLPGLPAIVTGGILIYIPGA